MKFMLVDAHCHLNSLSREQREIVTLSCSKNHVFIDSSVNLKSSNQSLQLSGQYPFIYTSLGFHPFWGKEWTSQTIKEYNDLISGNKKVVAIGEVGLDYTADLSLKEQEIILEEFIKLALREDLTVVIHNRFSPDVLVKKELPQIFNILDRFFSTYHKTIFHCFSYGEGLLEKILEKKGFVSFSLNILRRKESVISSLKMCPWESFILETDSPYMKINNQPSTPQNIKEVYSFVADIKNIEEEKLEQIVYSNIQRVFNL